MRASLTPVLFFCGAFMACAAIPVSTGTSTSTTTSAPTPSANVAAEVIAATNAERKKRGLPALVTSRRLTEAARIHAQQMAQFQRSEHTISGAKYPTLKSRLDAVGYAYFAAAENVAWNQKDVKTLMNSWMTSTGHRANILSAEVTEIGAAMVRSSKGEPYWIQVFGMPQIPEP